MDRSLALTIYRRLRSAFKEELEARLASLDKYLRDPFKLLIATILSQNTNDKNSFRAYKSLEERIGVSLESLARAEANEIADAIRVAGLYRVKAKVIKELSKIILNEYNGRIESLLNGPLDEVRDKLMKMPGVGAKTADILLLFFKGEPTFPVDTHVNRVSKRLGLAPIEGGYEEVRMSLMRKYPPKLYLEMHLLLILLGRKYCRSRNPSCGSCPLADLCPKGR